MSKFDRRTVPCSNSRCTRAFARNPFFLRERSGGLRPYCRGCLSFIADIIKRNGGVPDIVGFSAGWDEWVTQEIHES